MDKILYMWAYKCFNVLLISQPSRELAEQTNKQIELFKKKLSHPGISELLCVGGIAVKQQIESLNMGVSSFIINLFIIHHVMIT